MTMPVDPDTTDGVPDLPSGTIPIQLPPDQPEAAGVGNVLLMVVPMLGSMGVMVFMAMSQASNPRMMLMAGAMVVAMLTMVGFNVYRQIGGHRQKVSSLRREYLAYLSQTRDTVRTVAKKQRAYHRWHMPDPASLVLVAQEGSRLWERRDGSPTTMNVRMGNTTQTLAMELEVPELPPLARPDVVCHSAMNRFIETHAKVEDLPFGTPLGSFSHVELVGDMDASRAQLRSMLAHLAVFIPPTALKIAVLCSDAVRPEWEWVKWLPHARSDEASDALGPSRMIVSSQADLEDLLGEDIINRPQFTPRTEETEWPHVVVVVDDMSLVPSSRLTSFEGAAGVTVMKVLNTWGPLTSQTTVRMMLHRDSSGASAGAMEVILLDQEAFMTVPDSMSVVQAESVARRMTHWSSEDGVEASAPIGRSDPKRSVDLMELLGIGDIRDFDPDTQWKRREGRDRLRVPFAVTPEGVPVVLDIKEAAQEGMGPHGVLVGATGSGKSEVLRTLVLAMALTHSPEQLNFVLVDFKGGATFAGMSDLPHVSAMISNLESELSLVDRMQDAIRGEMVRRQELLRAAGNYANVTDYEKERIAGEHNYPALPALFIVLDEFSELLTAKPEFLDLFIAVGRLGRSMAIHLLLASQRLEDGRLRGLESHLSYRLGLKTFNVSESKQLLGVPDAASLPPYPGVGYLKTTGEQMTRFRASYVAAPPPPRRIDPSLMNQAGSAAAAIRVLPFSSTPVIALEESSPVTAPIEINAPGDERWQGMSEIDIAVERLRGKGMPAHQVWLPPLDKSDTLDQLMPDLAPVPGYGLVSEQWRAKGGLRFPLGTVDVPLEQRRDVLELDLSGAGGHVCVLGGPLSGKSTTLRSMVSALSLIHTPQEVQFFVLDLGGGSFASMRRAPHVATVVTRDQPAIVERLLAEIEAIIDDRERFFRENGIESMQAYRQGRARGQWDDGYGDVFLVVDSWATMRAEFEGIDQRIAGFLQRSLSFGVHLMVATSRWHDFRQQVQEVIGTRLELRLGTPNESLVSRQVAELVPEGRAGRGISSTGHHILICLPRIDGDQDPQTLADGVTDMVDRIEAALPAGHGPKLRLLPTRIAAEDVDVLRGGDGPGLVLGVEESRLEALRLSDEAASMMCVFGESRSGKTNFLRTVIRQVMRRFADSEAQIVVFDPRRRMLDHVPANYLGAYGNLPEHLPELVATISGALKKRLPTGQVTTEQLRNRSWWSGPEVWMLIDDYDVIPAQSSAALAELKPFIQQARDVGFNLVLARRSGGASRALYDPTIQAMMESGATVVMLSVDPDEGLTFGRVKGVKAEPGRAQVLTRDSGRIVAQISWVDPHEGEMK